MVDTNGLRSTATLVSEPIEVPATLQWKGVAKIVAKGLLGQPTAALIEIAMAAQNRMPLSAVSVWPGMLLAPESSFVMFVGGNFL